MDGKDIPAQLIVYAFLLKGLGESGQEAVFRQVLKRCTRKCKRQTEIHGSCAQAMRQCNER